MKTHTSTKVKFYPEKPETIFVNHLTDASKDEVTPFYVSNQKLFQIDRK